MDNSPFRSSGQVRLPTSPLPASHQDLGNNALEIVTTSEVQKWMAAIEAHLNEVCSIATEGKLNSDQKLKISNLCRKVGHSASQMAVIYQALKQKALQIQDSNALLEDNRDLTAHISGLKKTIESKCSAGTPSFADMVKKGPNNFIRPNNLSSVAIYPSDKQKSSEETKDLVQKIIRPEQMKLQVRGVRKTKNGGVIISTETKSDAEKLKQAVRLSSTSGLTADEPHKRKPRIVVVGVPTCMPESETYRCIFEQNVADKCPSMTFEDFLSSIKLSHKSGRKETPTCNYILEVPASLRKTLISQARLFINWTSCPVRDFTIVTRCYKCQQYGHAAKTCREVTSTCGHCGETGHSMAECKKKTESPKCATCSRFKKPNDHQTGDTECPAKKAAEYRYINSIDYEGA